MKRWRRLHKEAFFYMEGGHVLKANLVAETRMKIDEKVNNVVELVKRWESTIWKNMKRLLEKENGYETLLYFRVKNGREKWKRLHDDMFFDMEGWAKTCEDIIRIRCENKGVENMLSKTKNLMIQLGEEHRSISTLHEVQNILNRSKRILHIAEVIEVEMVVERSQSY